MFLSTLLAFKTGCETCSTPQSPMEQVESDSAEASTSCCKTHPPASSEWLGFTVFSKHCNQCWPEKLLSCVLPQYPASNHVLLKVISSLLYYCTACRMMLSIVAICWTKRVARNIISFGFAPLAGRKRLTTN